LYKPDNPFSVVVSLGVLHHTDNCTEAIRHIIRNYVAIGGYVYIGLYHEYGRRPFLDHFAGMKKKGASEDEMLAEFGRLHSSLKNPTHVRSWFRDQVLHPQETQHTIKEIASLLLEEKAELLSTSINRFQKIHDLDQLFETEKGYETVSRNALAQGRYFPGFFTFLARKA
jgi:hypothetical protein